MSEYPLLLLQNMGTPGLPSPAGGSPLQCIRVGNLDQQPRVGVLGTDIEHSSNSFSYLAMSCAVFCMEIYYREGH